MIKKIFSPRMRMFLKIVVSLLLASCASPIKKSEFHLPPIDEQVIGSNGMKVLFVPNSTLPQVTFLAMVKTGSRHEDAKYSGLNMFTSGMLRKGTLKKNADQVADSFGAIGSELLITPGQDFTTISAQVLSPYREELFQNFVEVLKSPRFADVEIEKLRSQYEASLKKSSDNPDTVIDLQADAYLFGEHPYGRNIMGTSESLKTISKKDIQQHYQKFYQPSNMVIAVSGQIDDADKKKIIKELSTWTGSSAPVVPMPGVSQVQQLQMKFVSKPGLKQTQIRFQRIGVQRSHPDILKLRLASEILGGSFGTRLMTEIREKRGLTYSISAGTDPKKDSGVFEISTFTKNETVEKIITETLAVYNQFLKEGVTEYELKSAKAQMLGRFPRLIETPDQLAMNLVALEYMGVDGRSYFSTFPEKINSYSVKEINEALREFLGPLKITVYGDPSIGAQLKNWNPSQSTFSSL